MRDTITENNQLIKAKTQEVYEAGKKAERKAWWDAFQQYGNRRSYNRAFYEWPIEAFDPPYDIVMEGASNDAFAKMKSIEDKPFSITEKLQQNGVALDTSKATDVGGMFLYYQGYSIPYLDFSSATSCSSLFFYASKVVTIEGIKVNKNLNLNGVFQGCSALEHIRFEGEIGNNISFADSPNLSGASMLDAAAHLVDFSTTDPIEYPGPFAHTIIFSEAACNKAFEEDEEFYTRLYYYTETRKWNLTTV